MCNTCILTPAIDLGYIVNITSGIITPSDELTAALDDNKFIGNATELICSCIDMAKASTWGSGTLADWYTNLCPDCTAMQSGHSITWNAIPGPANGTLEDPRIKFVKVPLNSALPTDGENPFPYKLMDCNDYPDGLTAEEKTEIDVLLINEDCIIKDGIVTANGELQCNSPSGKKRALLSGVSSGDCMVLVPFDFTSGYMLIHIDDVIATSNIVPAGDDCVACMRSFNTAGKVSEDAYACEQYCMNPYTTRSGAQFTQCMDCIKDDVIDAVYVCDACIQAFNSYLPTTLDNLTISADGDENYARRESCMECAKLPQTVRTGETPLTWPVSSRDWACVECQSCKHQVKS
ncbi:hypothetical protein FOA52_012645 [Chlamydomonas sp. UWO 241]|nr:hypothetical protein FOA52_012645 [Chlamydomonas sp. UWO 241]